MEDLGEGSGKTRTFSLLPKENSREKGQGEHQAVLGLFLQESPSMAWWTDFLLFGARFSDKESGFKKEESLFASFRRVLQNYVYENFLDILYFFLSIFTYLYLGFSVVTFFFQKHLPLSFPYIIDALSEPYLGALGIYVLVKEIERRRGRVATRRWGELFTVIWFLFFLTATVLTIFSDQYRFSIVYKSVVTNALAAIIIRIGTLLR